MCAIAARVDNNVNIATSNSKIQKVKEHVCLDILACDPDL